MTDVATHRLTFYYPTQAAATSVATLRAPTFGEPTTIDLQQVIQQSGGNVLIVLDRGNVLYTLEFEINQMDRTDRDALWEFFRLRAEGAANTFELRVPQYDRLDAERNPVGAWLYTGCQFTHADLRIPYHVDGFSTTLSIRATGRSEVA